MENMNMALLPSYCSTPKLVFNTYLINPTSSNLFPRPKTSPFKFRNPSIAPLGSRISISAVSRSGADNLPQITQKVVAKKSGGDSFARISSSTNNQTSSVGVNPNLSVPPPSSQIGSPLFWIGVGVGLSALFTWVASSLKKYAMQQAFKTVMNQMNTQNSPFSTGASPFPFPTTPTPAGHTVSPSPAASWPAVTVDVPATKVEAAPEVAKVEAEAEAASATSVKNETEATKENKKYAFVDVSPDDTIQKSPFESFEDVDGASSSKNVESPSEVYQNGAASKLDFGAFAGSQFTKSAGSGLSVEALEKMMEDPTVQKMVYPYLPEEMRNPETFKWMMQNPQYRKQLEEMLSNMSGTGEWDSRMTESLKNFDLNSPEVKQQFDQIGMTPEEVISKIMANPEVAMAFQNPRVQQAIMDCSTNPLNIAKYQNDKEVMDVFNKISELFPGASGPY